ncbi:unnamed protein product [Blepharisma stoltei]|uniref:O(6)-methylguanine-induced apoptosis 2 n=1 Tax=Blepharisma stoltei TaxID=1481888 RepID=A0AAU9JZE2_9CILI|nr:unnamed protein product [Blepharisma stoltei]
MAESSSQKSTSKSSSRSRSPPKPRSTSPYKKTKCLLHSTAQFSSQISNSLIGKESSHWSFSKADRFKPPPKFTGAEYANIQSHIGKSRTTTFGYGKRWQPSNPKGKDSPSPNKYRLPSCFDNCDNGAKIFTPVRNESRRLSTPGPGSYDIKSFVGESPSYTFKGRNILRSNIAHPPPGAYDPNHSLVESGRYTAIEFGRKSPTKHSSGGITPGPGTYDFGSTFGSDRSPSPVYKRSGRRTFSLDFSNFY